MKNLQASDVRLPTSEQAAETLQFFVERHKLLALLLAAPSAFVLLGLFALGACRKPEAPRSEV